MTVPSTRDRSRPEATPWWATRARADLVWSALALTGVALVVVQLLRPTGQIGDFTNLAAVTGAAVVACVGALRPRLGPSPIARLIAVGLTGNAVGEWIWVITTSSGQNPNVSVADAAYFTGYVALGAALFIATLVRTDRGSRIDLDAVIDALTITVVSVLVFWSLSISAIVADTTVTGSTRLVWAAYPVLDAILLALVARAMTSRRSKASIGLVFGIGLGFWMVGDVGYVLTTSGQLTGVLNAAWMTGAMLIAVSAWRRPEPEPEAVSEEVESGHLSWRLGIATVPILFPLVLHMVEHARGAEEHLVATMISVTVLLLLSFLRSSRLLASESRARTEARASRDAAVEASRAKSAFLATMSHEIRTPMNGVIGLTGLLQKTRLDERQKEYVDGVHLAGEALLRIINDILDFSKNEAGKLELDIIDFNLVQVVEETAALVAESAQSKNLELLAYCSPELPLGLRGDPSRLRQILLNLASNAVKFTTEGEVVIRAQVDGDTADGPVVRFEVSDTGLGLDQEDRQRLFEPFSQADSTTTRRFGGTGLGLAICRQLVAAMGGTLGVESELGRGSTFWFTLPLQLAAADQSVAPSRSTDGLAGQRVLVVDDNHTNRLVLFEQLGAWGMRADVAVDGPSSLALLEEAADRGAPYAMVLLDLCMPQMDGLELAARISANPKLTGVPLVLLTSVPDVSADQARDAGIAVRLTKPVQLSRLHSALQEVTKTVLTGPPRMSSTPVAQQPRSRGHVLVVEDNHVNQLVAVGILEYLGYTTEVAGNGLEALAAYARTPFDALLMDCQMPEMDGYVATREIRRLESGGARTPIIAMTAGVSEGERDRCRGAGMDDYVSKPVNPRDLDAALVRWLPAALT